MTAPDNEIPLNYRTDAAKRAYCADRSAITIVALAYRAAQMVDAYNIGPAESAPTLDLTAKIWMLSHNLRQYCEIARTLQDTAPDLANGAAANAASALEELRSAADLMMERLQSHVDALGNNIDGAYKSAQLLPITQEGSPDDSPNQ